MDVFTPYVYDRVREYGNMLSLTGRLKPGVTLAQAQAEADLLFPTLDGSVKRGYKGRLHRPALGSQRLRLRQASAARSSSSGERSDSSSSSSASTSPTSCSPAPPRAPGNSPCAPRSEPHAAASSASSSPNPSSSRPLGAILGLGLAFAAVFYLAHQGSIALPLLSSIRIDKPALAWTLFIAVLVGLLFGIAPGLRISSGNLQDALKDSAASTTGGRERPASAPLSSSPRSPSPASSSSPPGFSCAAFSASSMSTSASSPRTPPPSSLDYNDSGDPVKRAVFDREVLRRIEAIPGVQTAAMTDSLPMSRNRSWGISAKGKHYQPDELPGTFVYVVTPGYLNAIGMRLVKGRDISWEDIDPKQAVVIVNETVARYLWPNEDPINRIANVGDADARVIGVIADVRETTAEAKSGWQMYISAAAPQYGPDDSQLVIRSSLPAEILQPTVLATLRQINPGQPAADLKPIQLLVDHASAPRRFFVYLVGIFAALGLILASLGIYGVISYSVTQRTHEIGIRMALGATQGTVQLGIITQTLRMALLGTLVGTFVSLAVSSLIASLLFGTDPTDPATFAVIFTLLIAVALAAGYIPARRASRIDPMVALRNN